MSFKKKHTSDEIFDAMKKELVEVVNFHTKRPQELDYKRIDFAITQITALTCFLLGVNKKLHESEKSDLANLAWACSDYVSVFMMIRRKHLDMHRTEEDASLDADDIDSLEEFMKRVPITKFIDEKL